MLVYQESFRISPVISLYRQYIKGDAIGIRVKRTSIALGEEEAIGRTSGRNGRIYDSVTMT
ncbi:hypothetical protein GCM10007094_39500 [Pseudovibrio japonicus]|uniref:Uncharacterized protein n=1 Tax=Pseudovibrio japonicus TaxID=366534 RepID=A0ABQ3EM11_9HYPH|nr:hypothetical protein GCM10007094_39500 [Pseudovibrio japonicus]